MKKILSMLLVFAMMFGLLACGKSEVTVLVHGKVLPLTQRLHL